MEAALSCKGTIVGRASCSPDWAGTLSSLSDHLCQGYEAVGKNTRPKQAWERFEFVPVNDRLRRL